MPQILDRRQWFRIAGGLGIAKLIRAESAPARIALISDTHIPADPTDAYRGFRPFDNLKQTATQVAASDAKLSLICGDLARLHGLPGDYDNLRSLLTPISAKMPVGMLLGNHDDRKHCLAAFPSSAGSRPQAGNRFVSVLEYDNWRIVLLDSLIAPNVTPGQLGLGQRTWLTRLLLTDTRPTLIFVHHDLSDGDDALVDADKLLAIVRPLRHVKAIFYGHTHAWRQDRVDGLHLINLPAVAYNFTDAEPTGWVTMTLAAMGADFELHANGGNRVGDGSRVSLLWR